MTTRMRNLIVLSLATSLLAAPAAAEIFTITLKNGTVFESRYRPVEATWDSSQITFQTDWGNWTAIPKADVDSILSEIEGRGFGAVINTTTIAFGWDPALTEEETDALLAEGQEVTPEQQMQDRTNAIVNAFQNFGDQIERSRQVPDYSVEQFAEPDSASGQPIPGAWGNAAPGEDDFGMAEEFEDF